MNHKTAPKNAKEALLIPLLSIHLSIYSSDTKLYKSWFVPCEVVVLDLTTQVSVSKTVALQERRRKQGSIKLKSLNKSKGLESTTIET